MEWVFLAAADGRNLRPFFKFASTGYITIFRVGFIGTNQSFKTNHSEQGRSLWNISEVCDVEIVSKRVRTLSESEVSSIGVPIETDQNIYSGFHAIVDQTRRSSHLHYWKLPTKCRCGFLCHPESWLYLITSKSSRRLRSSYCQGNDSYLKIWNLWITDFKKFAKQVYGNCNLCNECREE